MILRFSLWALLIGSLVMGYFGFKTGSGLNALVGMAVIAFVIFLLYFLAKSLINFGFGALRIFLMAIVIIFTIVLLIKGCQFVVTKTTRATQQVSASVKDKMDKAGNLYHEKTEQMSDYANMYDYGSLTGTTNSWFDKLMSYFSFSKPKPVISPTVPIAIPEEQPAPQLQTISGKSSKTLSGNMFKLNSYIIKLYGIDAPDLNQKCLDSGNTEYKCGKVVKNQLNRLLTNKKITCTVMEHMDNSSVTHAVCKLDKENIDVGAVMTLSGWTIADRGISDVYIPYEQQAHGLKKGLWSGRFMAPWDFRRLNNYNNGN